ncbi:MAG: class I SAM-dependent methyltransferase [Candidatus Moranbacteria bacterium]|nr:class I SAM-dependent methyltransferase [Candidatus Moranbacteria bacterium]
MSVKNPKEFWSKISNLENWRDYILPRNNFADFDKEGYAEAQRLFYFYDKSSVVVDYGCGIGRVAKYVAPRTKKFIGLDINPDFVVKARDYVKEENVEFYTIDQFKNIEFADLVYSLMVLQHNDADHRQLIISHIHLLLKKGGVAIINFPRFESDYYQENNFLHKFKREEVDNYGCIFSSCRIIEGNLPNYEKEFNNKISHEYFIIARK